MFSLTAPQSIKRGFVLQTPNEGYRPKSDDLIKLLPERKVLLQPF